MLHDALKEYSRGDVYPFHMPGHKRKACAPDPYSIDITEIEGFDDLHAPEGLIKELQESVPKEKRRGGKHRNVTENDG